MMAVIWLHLTNEDGTVIQVNMDHVRWISSYDSNATLLHMKGHTLNVKEPFDEIHKRFAKVLTS